MKHLLILTPENPDVNAPTKVLNKDLKKIKEFSAGLNFYFETFTYENLHEAMQKVFTLENSFITLGMLTPTGRELELDRIPGRRIKRDKEIGSATIKDKNGTEIVLDLDDHYLEGYDALNPESGIKKWLDAKEINCDVTWQITSGQKLNTSDARIRLYFECDKPCELVARKSFSQSEKIQADGSVYTCSQPIYTAPPKIEGGVDPIPVRTGFIKGEVPYFKILEIPYEEAVKNAKINRSGYQSDYDYTIKEIPDEVKKGTVYRRYFMPYAFYLANKKLSREEIFAIIEFKSQASPRAFDPENVYQYIDGALEKIGFEQDEEGGNGAASAEELMLEKDDVPVFPTGLMDLLPEPWGLIYKNYRAAVSGIFVDPILFATIMSTNAHFLNSKYLTGFGKGKIPNTFNLILYPSGGGKDTNTTGVIRNLSTAFNSHPRCKFPNTDMFSIIRTEYKDNISSDSGFLNAFNRESQSLFMLDTEATKTIKKINSQGNENVSNLGQKFIEAANGDIIRGKVMAGDKKNQMLDIFNPTVQIMLAGQPETTAESLTPDNISSGLLARCNIFYSPPEEGINDNDFMLDSSTYNFTIDEEFYNFYMGGSLQRLMLKNKERIDGRQLKFTEKAEKDLNRWISECVIPLAKKRPELKSLLLRIIYIVEQFYTIILGVMQQWDVHHGRQVRQEFDPMILTPIAEYYMNMKLYLLRNVINKALDPFSDSILEVLKVIIMKPETAGSYYKKQCATGFVPIPCIKAMLSSRSKYQYLKNQYQSVDQRIMKTLEYLEDSGEVIFVKDKNGKKMYSVPSRDGGFDK